MAFDAVTLEGRHVRLEPLAEVHVAALARHASDMEIWRYMPVPGRDGIAVLTAWYERLQRARAGGNALVFATIACETGQAIGGTSMQDISVENRSLEIGATWLSPTVWRTVVNTECKLLLLRHAFDVLGCNRVQLKTDSRNLRSQAAIERLGAKKEGVLRSHMVMPDGHLRDSVYYSIIRPEWAGVRAALERRLARG